jgi:hypothetical protein
VRVRVRVLVLHFTSIYLIDSLIENPKWTSHGLDHSSTVVFHLSICSLFTTVRVHLLCALRPLTRSCPMTSHSSDTAPFYIPAASMCPMFLCTCINRFSPHLHFAPSATDHHLSLSPSLCRSALSPPTGPAPPYALTRLSSLPPFLRDLPCLCLCLFYSSSSSSTIASLPSASSRRTLPPRV